MVDDSEMERREEQTMNALHRDVRSALNRAENVRYEGDKLTPYDVDWDDIDDVNEAVDLWRYAQAQLVAAKQVERVASQVLAELIGDGGAVGYGDNVVRYKLGHKETCIDPDAMIQYLTAQVKSDFVDLADVVNPQYVKRSWMQQSVRDTFYEWQEDDAPRLTITPSDRVPKRLQNLNDGEVVMGKTDE
jgi:hypothetical protein